MLKHMNEPRKLTLEARKVRLQYNILQDVKQGKNTVRIKEQQAVFKRLLNPRVLFTSKDLLRSDDDVTVKYLNFLTRAASNLEVYNLLLKD